VGSARPAVSRPGWGREAPGRSGLSWREAPVTPEGRGGVRGGGSWGYHLAHMKCLRTHFLHGVNYTILVLRQHGDWQGLPADAAEPGRPDSGGRCSRRIRSSTV